eukprot:COSAG02_NODE_6717_length_3403_cov_2.250908_2_plen_89_part_00
MPTPHFPPAFQAVDTTVVLALREHRRQIPLRKNTANTFVIILIYNVYPAEHPVQTFGYSRHWMCRSGQNYGTPWRVVVSEGFLRCTVL